jgi:glutathione S-transferase
MSELKLYADADCESPWVFHAFVALEELELQYKLESLRYPIAPEIKNELRQRALLGKIPCLVHGDFWLSESSAVSEYLAELFPPPTYRRLMPASVEERARARQMMSWLRTGLMGLREERPTSSVFRRPVTTPLSEKGRSDAEDLIRVAEQIIPVGRQHMFSEWCIGDVDLALMLMRLVANSDPMPERLVEYALGTWSRRSVRRYLANIPTMS